MPQTAALGLDVSMLALATAATYLAGRAAGLESLGLGWTLAFPLLVLAVLGARGLYRPLVRLRTLDDLRSVVTATTLALLVLATLVAVGDVGGGVADELVRSWAFATVYVAVGRLALYRSIRQGRLDGEGLRPTLIVGAGRVGRLVARRLLASPELGLQPVGFLDKDPLDPELDGVTLPVLGASWDLERVIERAGRRAGDHHLLDRAPNDVLLRLVRRCEELGVEVAVVPRLYEKVTTRLEVEHVGGLPLVYCAVERPCQLAVRGQVRARPGAGGARDRAAAARSSLAAALAVRRSVGGPVLFRQPRVGRDGQRVRDPQVPDDARTASDEEPFALDFDLAPGRRRRVRSAHARRDVPAQDVDRRAAAAVQRAARAR